MPRFPKAESQVAELAELVVNGLSNAPEDFPAPPVPMEELQAKLDTYRAELKVAVTTESAAREQYAVKDEALEDLVDSVKANLRYAEVAVRNDPEKLNKLGWGPRRSGTSIPMPGEVRDISVKDASNLFFAQITGMMLLHEYYGDEFDVTLDEHLDKSLRLYLEFVEKVDAPEQRIQQGEQAA